MENFHTNSFRAPSAADGKDSDHKQCQHFFTKDETLLPGFWRQLYATVAVSVAAFSSGNVLGWMGPMVLKLPSDEGEVKGVTPGFLENLLIVMQVSSIVNMMICAFMMDIMGRRAGCWFLNLFAPAGWVFLATARFAGDLYVGVVMVSATAAAGLAVPVVFITDVCHETLRGPFLSLVMFSHSCGALFSHILGETLSYKCFNLCCLAVSLFFPFVFHPLPESPVFLVLKSRLVEAKTSLDWYFGNDQQAVENKMLKLQNAVDSKRQCKTMLSSKGDIMSLSIILFLSILSELCGTSVIEAYTGVIIRNTIKRPELAGKIALILAFLRFISGFSSVYFVERTGRKRMISVSLGVMAGSLVLLSIILEVACLDGRNIWLVAAVLGIYTVANQISLAVGEIICSEVSASDKRGIFMGIGGTFRILTLIVCLQIYTILSRINVYGNYLFEAASCLLGMAIVIRTIPETQGKTLATIRDEIEKEVLPQRPDRHLPLRECIKIKPPIDSWFRVVDDVQKISDNPVEHGGMKGPAGSREGLDHSVCHHHIAISHWLATHGGRQQGC